MTRQLSANQLKGKVRPVQQKPREGSNTRKAYDKLRRGEIVHFISNHLSKKRKGTGNFVINNEDVFGTSILNDLMIYYGMEVVATRKGHKLIGEWYGPYFVSIEKILMETDDEFQ